MKMTQFPPGSWPLFLWRRMSRTRRINAHCAILPLNGLFANLATICLPPSYVPQSFCSVYVIPVISYFVLAAGVSM